MDERLTLHPAAGLMGRSVGGTIARMRVRGSIGIDDAGWSFSLGPAWLRDCPVGPGDVVKVVISPEVRIECRRQIPDPTRCAGDPRRGSVLRLARSVQPKWLPAVDQRDETSARHSRRTYRRGGPPSQRWGQRTQEALSPGKSRRPGPWVLPRPASAVNLESTCGCRADSNDGSWV
jgi:hypothetical protein